jgi:hypothetical protein
MIETDSDPNRLQGFVGNFHFLLIRARRHRRCLAAKNAGRSSLVGNVCSHFAQQMMMSL